MIEHYTFAETLILTAVWCFVPAVVVLTIGAVMRWIGSWGP